MQTVNEFVQVAIRKYSAPVEDVRDIIASWTDIREPVAATSSDTLDALRAVEAHGIPFRNALLWATARRAGARWRLSEDFPDGRSLDGVTILDPFARANDQAIERLFR